MHYKMLNLDNIKNENNKERNKNGLIFLIIRTEIFIIGSSGSGKTNALLNLVSPQGDIDKMYVYAKDLSEPEYEVLIKKREDAVKKHLSDLITFIKCSNTIGHVYKNIDDYNPSRQKKS